MARVIPQWVKGKEDDSGIFESRAPNYILSKCKGFGIEKASCPKLVSLKIWYKTKSGKELGANVRPSDIAPNFNSPFFIQKISSANDILRNQFTLRILENLLKKYKRVAVVYGGAHYTSLKNSIEASMGKPVEIVVPEVRTSN